MLENTPHNRTILGLTGIEEFLSGPNAILRGLIAQLGIHDDGGGGINVSWLPESRGGEGKSTWGGSTPRARPIWQNWNALFDAFASLM